MIVSVTTVIQVGETVQVDAIALLALEGFQQAALTHSSIELEDGNSRDFGIALIALLVIMVHQAVG